MKYKVKKGVPFLHKRGIVTPINGQLEDYDSNVKIYKNKVERKRIIF